MIKEKKILILLFVFLIGINYPFIDGFLKKTFDSCENGLVERIVDGDTIKINGTSVRLLGINSPEKGEIGYRKAKEFLEEMVLDKQVKICFGKEKQDKYGRKLGYVFLDKKNINLESVKKGFSNFYFPSGKDKYYSEFISAWKMCMKEGKNLCERSAIQCINLKNWDIENQKIVLMNDCANKIKIENWSIKDEGRKKYVFDDLTLLPKEKITLVAQDWNKTYVWTKTGDSIIIRDHKNKLVFFDYY